MKECAAENHAVGAMAVRLKAAAEKRDERRGDTRTPELLAEADRYLATLQPSRSVMVGDVVEYEPSSRSTGLSLTEAKQLRREPLVLPDPEPDDISEHTMFGTIRAADRDIIGSFARRPQRDLFRPGRYL
ncbi:MAG: hypothetical protein AB7R77_05980 [Ilumatobacteraceae bacterium]